MPFFGLLSLPNWIIHISSVIEWTLAMGLFWVLGNRLNEVWLKRMLFAMVPYTISGFCALFYHATGDTVKLLNEMQSYLTFIGSTCFAIWGWLYFRNLTSRLESRSIAGSAAEPVTNLPEPAMAGGKVLSHHE